MTNEECKAADRQVGGDHYKRMAMQPFAYIHANGLGFAEGNVIKYVSRWRHKNGLQDLEKAAHYLQLLIDAERATAEPEPPEPPEPPGHDWSESPDTETTQASSAPDDTTTVTQWLGDTPPEPELNDAEKQMVRDRLIIPAIKSLRERWNAGHSWPYPLSLVDAKKIVEAYRDSLKAATDWSRLRTIDAPYRDSLKASKPCPTGVPENGDWYPHYYDHYWIPGKERHGKIAWTRCDDDMQRLEDGDVCRTCEIARTVQRRRKAAGKAVQS